ncbi:uncharacterized protein LOC119998604 [Tripterygium wilfordii]|uniref:uncharacterized protein LOC119998604 n=1 Tax=Tripterygium wilfordii TaxID=458696 RepID=UPI0018F8457A|nr:uncharacterized protein LOC119998604 [Tripterygium wilfordii]
MDGVRGTGFGLLSLIGTLGGIGGGVLATLMAGQHCWGIPGWRCAFILMAALSALIGFLVLIFVTDPKKAISVSHASGEDSDSYFILLLSSKYAFFPPRHAASLDVCGFRDLLIEKSKASASSIWLESWTTTKAVIKVKTYKGRIMCAQFSAFMGIPFSWFLLRVIPQSVSSYYTFATTVFLWA